MTQEQEVPLDHKDLKIRALLERIAELTATYEDKDADRRVTITILGQRVKELTPEEEVVELPDVEKKEKTSNNSAS